MINGAEENVEEKICQITDGRGVDLVIEDSGYRDYHPAGHQYCEERLQYRPCGIQQIREMTLPMSLVLDKELTFKTVFRYRHNLSYAIEAVSQGKVNLKGS